jgi:hypothetical protein
MANTCRGATRNARRLLHTQGERIGAALFAALEESRLALTCAIVASPRPPTSLRVQQGQTYHQRVRDLHSGL